MPKSKFQRSLLQAEVKIKKTTKKLFPILKARKRIEWYIYVTPFVVLKHITGRYNDVNITSGLLNG
jgi:hypothetical protein